MTTGANHRCHHVRSPSCRDVGGSNDGRIVLLEHPVRPPQRVLQCHLAPPASVCNQPTCVSSRTTSNASSISIGSPPIRRGTGSGFDVVGGGDFDY
jgi:hypothetical protein